jgi:hypothetical protein
MRFIERMVETYLPAVEMNQHRCCNFGLGLSPLSKHADAAGGKPALASTIYFIRNRIGICSYATVQLMPWDPVRARWLIIL